MIDPNIALQGRVTPFGSAGANFINSMDAVQGMRQRAAQEQRAADMAPLLAEQAQLSLDNQRANYDEATENRIIRSVAEFGAKLKPVLESGDTDAAQTLLATRLQELQQKGLPTNETVDAITSIRSGNTQAVIDDIDYNNNVAMDRGLLQSNQRQFAAQKSAPIIHPESGQVSTPVFDPNLMQTKLVPIEGAIQETPTQKSQREFDTAKRLADLDVSTTKQKETIKKRVARTSELKKAYSTKRRQSANSLRRIKETQKLTEKASQGLTGTAKLALSRVFPGIDAQDEGALSGAFKSLALDELQKFTGPTTDFEFEVSEDIAGSLGGGASANQARLASLERAAWFAQREAKQFSEHEKRGLDPDEFAFNFEEEVDIRTPSQTSSYTLQSLQDTAVANHISIDEVIKRLKRLP